MNINNYLKPELINFKPYRSARMEQTSTNVWLNANECPWDLHQKNDLAKNMNRYPSNASSKLTGKLAEIYQVDSSELLITRSSDEGIELLIKLCCRPYQDNIVTFSPTFGMYQVAANILSVGNIDIPLLENNFQLDKQKLWQIKNNNSNYSPVIPAKAEIQGRKTHQLSKLAVDSAVKPRNDERLTVTNNTKLIFVCSPNNPTGNLINPEDIIVICDAFKEQALVVVDEAYIEFANQASMSQLINQYENLVILRTLSKAYALAGIRIGAVIANPTIIQYLQQLLPPYPFSPMVIDFATEALTKNIDKVSQFIDYIKNTREELCNSFIKLDFIEEIYPSEANFILIKSKDAEMILQNCQRAGIAIRDMRKKLKNCLRITIGTLDENDSLLKCLCSEVSDIWRF
jgi:histidinol-phosphate aminotransferase